MIKIAMDSPVTIKKFEYVLVIFPTLEYGTLIVNSNNAIFFLSFKIP